MREKLLDRAFCAGFLVAQAAGWMHWASAGPELSVWWSWPLLFLASWLAADAASGIAHYAADNWGSTSTPIFGRTFIEPFRRHHHHPTDLLQHDLFELNGNNCFLAGLSIAWIPWVEVGATSNLWMVFFLFLSLWASLTNQIHAWAHQPASPWPVRWLQTTGILLSSQQHARHHTHFTSPMNSRDASSPRMPGARAYCITSGAWDRIFGALSARARLTSARRAQPRRASPRAQPLSSR